MNYKEIKSAGFLSTFVKSFWFYQTSDSEVQHTILPDGYFDLIAEFENEILKTVKLTGIWTKPKDIRIPKNTTFFAVRFKILAIEYLFKSEIKSVLDSAENLPFSFWNIEKYRIDEFEKFAAEVSQQLNTQIQQLNKIDSRKLKLFELVYQHKVKTVAEFSAQIF